MAEPSRNEVLFVQLVAMFQFAAMQQMGKIANPVTGNIERDLEQARLSIDMIEMLEARTRADRTPGEAEILDKVLFELRMNYVDECKRAAAEHPGEAAGPTGPGPGEAR
jgi:Domain of unknown function (DUF1844)